MDISFEKTLPNNMEAERAILGAILLDCSLPSDVKIEDFYLDQHRSLLETLQEINDRGEKIDLITAKNALQLKNQLEAVGGAAYLVSLTDGLPRLDMVPQYLRIIRRTRALRDLIKINSECLNRGFQDEEEPSAIIGSMMDACDEVNSMLDQGSGLRKISDLVETVYAEIEARANTQTTGAYATGFIDLDKMLSGGIRPQNQVIIAGRPGSGKSAFLSNILINMAKKGIKCAFFSLEMGYMEIIERMICSLGCVDGNRIRTGFLNKDDWNKITRAVGELCDLPIWIDDSTGITVADMRSRIRKIHEPIQIMAADYLQLISPPERLRRNADEFEVTAAVSKSLKFMAKSMDLGLLTVSQLSRASEKRKDRRPQLSDLRSSGQIEQDADVVMFVYREEMADPTEENTGTSQIIIGKQRNGPIGDVKLAFEKEYTLFHNLYED
jgi:replicative DNA helicase